MALVPRYTIPILSHGRGIQMGLTTGSFSNSLGIILTIDERLIGGRRDPFVTRRELGFEVDIATFLNGIKIVSRLE